MVTYSCPKGHASTESDYCSECGAKIDIGLTARQVATPTSGGQSCPDCGTLHELINGKFCEICGYNFATGAHGELPVAPSVQPVIQVTTGAIIEPIIEPVVEPITAPPTDRVASSDQPLPVEAGVVANPLPPGDASTSQWEVVITIDPTRRHPDSPEPPTLPAPITRSLENANTLVGRSSQMRAIYPDIALDWDDAVSHRHALINRLPNGKLTVRDIGSSNGTTINGIEIAQMVDITINHGDEITLGHWTKLKIMQKS